MIQLIRSHNLITLSESLADKLAETAPDDPFTSQSIIVPNLDTARWFKIFAAERNRISANIECNLPAEWFYRLIRNLYPDLPELLPSDHHPMKWSILETLSDDSTRSQFSLINRYIQNHSDNQVEQALFQLSGKIASLFDEYLVYRPDMILRWQKGQNGSGDERWQAELWRLLTSNWSKVDSEFPLNRANLYHEVISALTKEDIEVDDTLFILNPGLLPMPTLKMLKKYGERADLYFYQVQLSKGIMENRNELIQAFGSEIKSKTELLEYLDPDSVKDVHPDIFVSSVLNQIQSDVLEAEPIQNLSADNGGIESIEIRSCHSPLREVEVLHQFLLEKFEGDEALNPDNILVATPDLETYRPYIQAVFDHTEDDLPKIPFSAGYSSVNNRGLERVLRRLLLLIESRFEFSKVMDLFMMKPVRQSFGVSESEALKVKRWIAENNVFWGIDADHRKEFGQPAEDIQTWYSAIKRGWYGQLLGGEDQESVEGQLVYHSIKSTNDQEIWAAFNKYLRLLDRMRKEIKQKKPCSSWAEWLTSRIVLFFDSYSLESTEVQKIKRVIGQIKEESETGNCRVEIPFSLFKREILSKFDRVKASGALFNRGVTFSSMVPVRSIPFKIVALIGLNENSFPRKKNSPDFDLMAQKPGLGERDRKNEDRNLFLETVMAAEKVHYCSYVGQSPVDNEEIPPSTIIHEWMDILSEATALDTKEFIKKETLSGFSSLNFQSDSSYSKAYFQVAKNILNDSGAISGLNAEHSIPLEESADPVLLDDLIRFYSNPVQWFLKKRFEVSLKEVTGENDEFVLDHLEEHLVFQHLFNWILHEKDDQMIQKYLIQTGSVPSGWAGERRVLELKNCATKALSLLKNEAIYPTQHSFPVSLTIDNVDLEGELTSYSENQLVDISPSQFSGKIALQSWIKHLCCIISEQFTTKHSLLFCELKKGDPKKKIFEPVQNPMEILVDLVHFYQEGMVSPQLFFPKTLYAYEERERDENKTGSYYEASKKFNSDKYTFGENSNLAVRILLGEDVEFREEFITERYRQIIGHMIDHMGEH